MFRSYAPRTQSERHFPALGTQLQGLFDDAEVLPCNNRDINFRLTARDGKSGQGTTNMRVTVQNTGAAFEILNLNDGATIVNPDTFTVDWEVADTTAAPISCDSVNIDLLTFNPDFSKYSVTLLQTTLNDGSADVAIVPATNSHPRARIRVACSNNVFYDISNVTFAITGTSPTASFTDNENDVFFNNNGTTGTVAQACGAIAQCGVDAELDDRGGGGSAADYRWLLLLAALLLMAHARHLKLFRS